MIMRILVAASLFAPAARAATRTHTVVKGDHLWALAGQYYQNHFRWKVIYSANQDKIKDPHWIYPGQVFTIPDVPGPEIGEVGARPIETAAPVKPPEAPAPAPAPAPEPAVVEAPPPPPAAAPKPESPPAPAGVSAIEEDLSTRLPSQMTGQYPSMSRLKAPAGWKADGHIVNFNGREILAAEGDTVNGKLSKGKAAQVGDRFSVYRKDVPRETDEDKKALYLQTVGWVKVVKDLGGSKYTFLVVKSGDSLQVGDMLKGEER